MPKLAYPRNPWLGNPRIAELYLSCLRKQWRVPAKLLGIILNCEFASTIPARLFIPHPFGIIVGPGSELANDVVLMQQVTLGCRRPYANDIPEFGYPIIKEGAYIGPGAKLMGRITIGEWSIVGANAVITIDVPPHGVAVGYNKILDQKSSDLWVPERSNNPEALLCQESLA